MENIVKSKTIVSVIVAMSLTTGGLAIAQDHGDRNDQGHNKQAQRDHNQAWQPGHRQNRERPDFGDQRGDDRGAGPNHAFHRGERLPPEYNHRWYVVDDWRGHNLNAPPRGYHWVQVGGDYVLVAIATGIILQLLLNN